MEFVLTVFLNRRSWIFLVLDTILEDERSGFKGKGKISTVKRLVPSWLGPPHGWIFLISSMVRKMLLSGIDPERNISISTGLLWEKKEGSLPSLTLQKGHWGWRGGHGGGQEVHHVDLPWGTQLEWQEREGVWRALLAAAYAWGWMERAEWNSLRMTVLCLEWVLSGYWGVK